jgi:dipeptidyl aminopeptidase/acylaminoacyl peptidase
MAPPTVAPYGAWRSPITAEQLAEASIGLGQIQLDGSDIYCVEMRPAEGGRNVIVRYAADEQTADVNPPPFNARTRVHEYGGGAFAVHRGTIYFANFSDQRLYRQTLAGEPEPLTPEPPVPAGLRYADAVIDEARNRLICVREDHTVGGEAVNTIVAIDLDAGGPGDVLCEGYDFFATPRLSPDGAQLAWLCWNHPNMPWDGCELWLADVAADGRLSNRRQVAGGRGESIFQPAWSPSGVLHFVSDRTGWWNLYRLRGCSAEALAPMEAEFGLPQWVFGMTTYGFDADGAIICAVTERATARLARIDTGGALRWIETPYNEIAGLQVAPGWAVFVGATPTEPRALVYLDLATGRDVVLRRSTTSEIPAAYICAAQPIEFPTEGGLTAHAFFYPPRNPDFAAPPGERPPLIVVSHGGPTGATGPGLNLDTQYWTSRGFAVVDVNYGGSTGYGTAYRRRLNGMWGIVDVDDCVNAARYLAQQGVVDGERLAIRGGSAGGYTTLAALTFREIFKAGASYFGVSDAEALAKETHKFESRYLDGLIGPYPQRRDLYIARSPIHHTDRLNCALILFQGLEDKVVPPNQAELMFEAVRAKGLPVAYLPFEGEQHGFRKAENIRRALEAELYFYGKVFGFEPADAIEPVPIENLA